MNAPANCMGWKAQAALAASAGAFAAIPGFESGAWRLAGGEPIWLGVGAGPMHPRAVYLRRSLPTTRIDLCAGDGWRPDDDAPRGQPRAPLAARALALAARIRTFGDPAGFAVLLAGGTPEFPLDKAVPAIVALAHAAGRDDAHGAFEPARSLLGLGPGLTPSGDDFVGALLFGRRLLDDAPAWEATAARLVKEARVRTHAISAALFADLAAGQAYAPLHRLATALARGCDAHAAASDLVAIGHSSGWEMLAGLLIGLAGPAPLCARSRSLA
jgi:hypothetical protein